MRKILFVDDDANVLEGLRRTFKDLRGKWALAFARSGPEAISLLKKVPFDVVVSDINISGGDGVEMMTLVMEELPHVVRIVLSSQTDQESAMKAANPAHLYLTKPYNADKLKRLMIRACTLRDRLLDGKLKDVVSNMKSLPSLPAMYGQLIKELGSEDASIQKVGEIISQDMGMVAKILKLVNSAYFGCRGTIESPAQAAAFLGLEMLKGLVMSVQIFSQYKSKNLGPFSVDSLWSHSMTTGVHARDIAKDIKADKALVGDAFMGGMLHDAGKLVLAGNFPTKYGETMTLSQEGRMQLWEAELAVFGTTHADVGAYLMGLWGLPDSIVEAIAYHHNPKESTCENICPLTFVHTSNIFSKNEGESEEEEEDLKGIDVAYLEQLGVSDKVHGWQELCQALAV